MSFRKIIKHNDRGYVYYAYDGEGFSTAGIADRKRGINFSEGQNVKIRWPDGSTSEEVLTAKQYTEVVSDHGLDHTIISHEFGILERVRGVRVFIDLAYVEIFDTGDEGEWSLL